MKKSSFVAMVLGTVSTVLFALGMCMVLIPEWNAWKPGIIWSCAGLFLSFITLFIWRKMEHKNPIHLSVKTVVAVIIGVIGALGFGTGMCFAMVWDRMAAGIVIGLIGILILLCLIPLTKGITD